MTFVLDGNEITPSDCTLTVAVAPETFGTAALAVITAEPAATPATAVVTLIAFCAIVTDEGVVAIRVALDLRATTSPPAGAGEDNVTVRFCDVPGARARI